MYKSKIKLIGAIASTFIIAACSNNESNSNVPPEARAQEAANPHGTKTPDATAKSGLLSKTKFTISSLTKVDLSAHTATIPVYKGMSKGEAVWYIITDVSDQATATQIGINFAPRLSHASDNCPGCVQEVDSSDPVLGQGSVTFPGKVDFSPQRMEMPSAKGFPPQLAAPGAIGDAMYSPLVRIKGQSIVYNASIIASGWGPFDTLNHTNTHDRLIALDPTAMTAEIVFVRAFAHGTNILYFSHEASDAGTAVIERATFTPTLAPMPFANGSDDPRSARAALFAFVNGKADGVMSPPNQGLNHVILNGNNPMDINDASVREILRQGGDAHNVLDFVPTESDPARRALYSPMWDVHLAQWSDAAVAAGQNTAQPDANTIRQLAAQGLITSPGGVAPLGSANIVVNCPFFAFLDEAPNAPLVTKPAGRP